MTTNLQIHVQAAGTEEHEAVHRVLSRLGGAASHKTDRTAMDILWGTWGGSPQPPHAQAHRVNSVRRRGGGEASSTNGVHRGVRPAAVRNVCTFIHSVCTGLSKPKLPGVKILKKIL